MIKKAKIRSIGLGYCGTFCGITLQSPNDEPTYMLYNRGPFYFYVCDKFSRGEEVEFEVHQRYVPCCGDDKLVQFMEMPNHLEDQPGV